jgi:enoyl-CoA hydratase/carnithine racemase
VSDIPTRDGFRLVQDGRVTIEVSGGVALLTLNRPEKRNAVDEEQIDALAEAFGWLSATKEIVVGVLAGRGAAFCAGGDIRMFQGLSSDSGLAFTRRGFDLLRPLETGEKPVIAAVSGYCLAGGLELALACDFIIAASDAVFGFGEVDLGLIPGWGGTARFARAVPVRRARQLTLTSERFDAAEAQRLGLVNEVVVDAIERALDIAAIVASRPTLAVRAAKMVFEASADGTSLDSALAVERSVAGALFGSSDVKAKVADWISHRDGNKA